MTSELAGMKCVLCKGGTPPLAQGEISALLGKIGGGWQVERGHHLKKEYKFKNFREALNFTNKVGELAEEQGHHPDIYLAWGKVRLAIWTHVIDGLTENDFILAAKIDALA